MYEVIVRDTETGDTLEKLLWATYDEMQKLLDKYCESLCVTIEVIELNMTPN